MNTLYDAFRLAFSMLSTLPIFQLHEFRAGINGLSVMFYPLVGSILGLLLFTTHLLLTPLLEPTHLMVLIFALYIIITGALHLDGFADTLDGLLSYKPKIEALKIMKDPHIGAMGVVFLIVLLTIKLSSFIHLEEMWHLILIPMLSRYSVLIAIYFFPYITNRGMATLAKREFCKKHLLIATLYTLLISLFFSNALILFIVALVTALLVSRYFVKKFDGLNGDIYGFIIEFTEVTLLQVALLL